MKKLLSLLCALCLLMALVPTAAVAAQPKATQNLYQQVLERDGFIEGVWYPWFTHNYLGCGLTTNEVAAKYITNGWYDFTRAGIDAYGSEKIYAEIYNLKAMGYNMLAYAGSAYGEGVIYDNNGDVLGIKEDYLANVRRFLSICRDVGMPVMWNVYFHCSSVPDYYGMDAWNMMCRMLGDPTVADHYAQRFVKPLSKVLGEYDDVVALIALTDEVENEINDSDEPNNWGYATKAYGTTKENIFYFVNAMNDAVKAAAPQIARTIAANSDDLGLYSDIEVDVLGRNRYSDNGDAAKLPEMYPSAPMLLTEYNLASASGKTEADFGRIHVAFRDDMKKLSYHGGFQWCWQPNAKGGVHDLLAKNATSTTDFRSYMYERYYYTMDALYAYQGKTPMVEPPSLFYHTGNGLLEWIPSRQAKTVTIESSTDGGKRWQTVASDLTQANLVTADKCVYQVKNASAMAMYRVTVKDAKGNTASAVTNRPGAATEYMESSTAISVTKFKRPAVVKAPVSFSSATSLSLTSFGTTANRAQDSVNLIKNGGCEQLNSGQWNDSDFLGDAIEVVYDKTTPDGYKSLHFDTRDSATPRWYTFKVSVAKYTDYTFSAWVKGAYIADDNRFYGSIGVLNPATKTFATYSSYNGRRSREDQQIYPPAWDNQWHLRSVTFNSGNLTEVVIGFYGAQSEMWIDGMALYNSSVGSPYYSENARGVVSFNYNYKYMRCDPAKSLTQNVRLEDGNSTYWQSGCGWDNGFMSVANAPDGYGKALKYTASSRPAGVSYIKWIPVKKETSYIVTFDYKVVKDGDALIRLGVKQCAGIVSAMTLEMSDTEHYEGADGWCTFSTKLNTSAFDRLAFIVTDLGGEFYVDNIRVFLPKDGADVQDVNNTSGTTAPVVRPTVTTTRPTTGTTTAATKPLPTEIRPSASTTTVVVEDGTTTAPIETQATTSAPAEDTPTHGEGEQKTTPPIGLWIGVGAAVLLIAGGVTAFLIWRKKKQS